MAQTKAESVKGGQLCCAEACLCRMISFCLPPGSSSDPLRQSLFIARHRGGKSRHQVTRDGAKSLPVSHLSEVEVIQRTGKANIRRIWLVSLVIGQAKAIR